MFRAKNQSENALTDRRHSKSRTPNVTSVAEESASFSRFKISATASAPFSGFRAVTITLYPLEANDTADARPSPELPPVIITVPSCVSGSLAILLKF
jgi:hypothetical protein